MLKTDFHSVATFQVVQSHVLKQFWSLLSDIILRNSDYSEIQSSACWKADAGPCASTQWKQIQEGV